MSAEGEFLERSEATEGSVPPLEGGKPRYSGARGVYARGTSRAPSSKKKQPWYKCKRCGKYVLSYKHSRGIHNRKCPPIVDPVEILIHTLFPKA